MKTITDVGFRSAVVRRYENKYKYPNLDNAQTIVQKVKVICPDHGVFHVKAIDHMHGKECPVCVRKKPDFRMTIEKFLELVCVKYGDIVYDYDELLGYKDRIPEKRFLMRCVKHSTKFFQSPKEHLLQSPGCPDCREHAQKHSTKYSLRGHIRTFLQAHLSGKEVRENWSFPDVGFVYAFYVPEINLIIDLFVNSNAVDTKLAYLRRCFVRSNNCGMITFYNKMSLNDSCSRFNEFVSLLKGVKKEKFSNTFEWGFF